MKPVASMMRVQLAQYTIQRSSSRSRVCLYQLVYFTNSKGRNDQAYLKSSPQNIQGRIVGKALGGHMRYLELNATAAGAVIEVGYKENNGCRSLQRFTESCQDHGQGKDSKTHYTIEATPHPKTFQSKVLRINPELGHQAHSTLPVQVAGARTAAGNLDLVEPMSSYPNINYTVTVNDNELLV
nr:hypothetical protein L203_04438 [Cryptococcus depauperatus CBS 7841]